MVACLEMGTGRKEGSEPFRRHSRRSVCAKRFGGIQRSRHPLKMKQKLREFSRNDTRDLCTWRLGFESYIMATLSVELDGLETGPLLSARSRTRT